MIALIAAMDEQGCIGKENQLPWHCKEELAYFKKLTLGKTIVMGRKTYTGLKKPLDDRTMIVVSTHSSFINLYPNVTICNDLEALFKRYANQQEMLLIGGGASIYTQALPYCDELYISCIYGKYDGDCYFPSVDWEQFKCIERIVHRSFVSYHFKRKKESVCSLSI